MSSIFGAGGVSKIIAGSGISLSPTNGKGDVTISASFSGVAVTSFNNRTGAVSLASSDVTTALGYTPAGLASPSFTGTPLAPTAAFGTSTTQLATTAFVQNAVSASVAGVSSFNTRTGAVTLTSGDITGTLGYTPAAVNSPSLTGVPTAPTASPGTNTTQLATTAFVRAAVVASTTGVASFNTRTGAVTLGSADVISSLTSTSARKDFIWNSSTPGAVDAGNESNIYIHRHAVYTGGTAGTVRSALHLQTYTPTNHNTYEWGLTSEVFSYSVLAGSGPQNVAINGTIWKHGTAPVWGGNFVAYDPATTYSGSSGPLHGVEIDVGICGVDPGESTIGVFTVAQRTDPSYTASLAIAHYAHGDGNANWRYGFLDSYATYASFASRSPVATFGAIFSGSYQVGVDTSTATTSVAAFRMGAGQYFDFEGTSAIRMKYNPANGYIEFYNGTTRRGYINANTGADVDLAGGTSGSGAVTSFNSRTGAITLTSADITTALGYTPANNSTAVNLGSNQTMTGYKIFNGGIASNTDLLLGSACTVNFSSASNVTFSAGAGASALPSNPAFFLRIVIDGTPYKIPVYNS